MTYWISMGSVLLIGYGLIKWSGRVNEQANEGSSGSTGVVATGKLGLRSPAKHNAKASTNNYGTNQGYDGGKA
jgi:hypothetical protein